VNILLQLKEKLLKDNIIDNFDAYDDLILLKFLRARKFDLAKTFEMFKNHILWRKTNDVDNIYVK
jgi:hypothetical protein